VLELGITMAVRFIPCPQCELPAEITDQFSLPSTDGPVDHAALSCIDGHHFRMALDRLSADAPERTDDLVAAILPTERFTGGSAGGERCCREPETSTAAMGLAYVRAGR